MSEARVSLSRVLVEMSVIVVSILLAFAIDAGWDAYRERASRVELVKDLILDFETTDARLDVAIARGDFLVERGREALALAASSTPIALDSVQFLLTGFFSDIPFTPALATYEAATGEAGLASLDSREFLEAVSDFERARRLYDAHWDVATNLFYVGPTLDWRRELGSLGTLIFSNSDCPGHGYNCPYPEAFERASSELVQFMRRPDVYGGLENIQNANLNLVRSLREMKAAVGRVLTALTAVRGDEF